MSASEKSKVAALLAAGGSVDEVAAAIGKVSVQQPKPMSAKELMAAFADDPDGVSAPGPGDSGAAALEEAYAFGRVDEEFYTAVRKKCGY